MFWSLPQYSEKEDKYEEEIKLLSDKLKEVRVISIQLVQVSPAAGLKALIVTTPFFCPRLRPVPNLQREQLQNWKRQLMTWKV